MSLACDHATPEEVLEHPNTKGEIWLLQRQIQEVATELDTLNATNATRKLEFLFNQLHDAAGRICTLQLHIEDPPTYYAREEQKPGQRR